MLVRRYSLKVALLTILFVVLAASHALAADPSCVRKGERIYAQGDRMVYVAKPISSRTRGWTAGSESIYACSSRHKVRVSVGAVGKYKGRPVAPSHLLGDEDYAAFVTDGRGLRGVRLLDLSSGSIVGEHEPLSFGSAAGTEITVMTLGREGDVGWIAIGRSAQGASTVQIRRARPGHPAQVVAEDLNIDPFLLRLSEGGVVEWSPVTSAISVQSRPLVSARARKTGNCLRKGESVSYSNSGVIVAKKRIRKDGYRGAYKLTACSSRYHRRIALGVFGQRFDFSFGAAGIQANTRYIAFAKEATEFEFNTEYTVRAYDLATGELTLSQPRGGPNLRLDERGNVAWIASYGAPRGGGWRRLNLFDARGVTTLVDTGTGALMDPAFLALEDFAGETKLHYAVMTAQNR